MDAITELFKQDFSSLFISIFIILVGIKAIVSLFEWVIGKLGLETKWMRKSREEHELLLKTSENLAELQEKHILGAVNYDGSFLRFILCLDAVYIRIERDVLHQLFC